MTKTSGMQQVPNRHQCPLLHMYHGAILLARQTCGSVGLAACTAFSWKWADLAVHNVTLVGSHNFDTVLPLCDGPMQ
jgi:hypothetical protein